MSLDWEVVCSPAFLAKEAEGAVTTVLGVVNSGLGAITQEEWDREYSNDATLQAFKQLLVWRQKREFRGCTSSAVSQGTAGNVYCGRLGSDERGSVYPSRLATF